MKPSRANLPNFSFFSIVLIHTFTLAMLVTIVSNCGKGEGKKQLTPTNQSQIEANRDSNRIVTDQDSIDALTHKNHQQIDSEKDPNLYQNNSNRVVIPLTKSDMDSRMVPKSANGYETNEAQHNSDKRDSGRFRNNGFYDHGEQMPEIEIGDSSVANNNSPNFGMNISDSTLTQQIIGLVGSVATLRTMTPEQEQELGAEIHQELITERDVELLANSELEQYINGITQKLVPYLERGSSFKGRDGRPYHYTYIVKDPSPNAFATVGGFNYVTTGLLVFLPNEASLAGVIAHELSHLDGRHVLRDLEEKMVTSTALSALDLNWRGLDSIVVDLGLHLRHSRARESEADSDGLTMLKRSEYAASEMVQFFERIQNTNPPPQFLSTHPSPNNRLDYFNSNLNSSNSGGGGTNNAEYRSRICGNLDC